MLEQDEAFAASLENPDHLQRQNLLIDTQRDQARRLRDFLAATRTSVSAKFHPVPHADSLAKNLRLQNRRAKQASKNRESWLQVR